VPIYHYTWCSISEDLTIQYYGDHIWNLTPYKNRYVYYKNKIFKVPSNVLEPGGYPFSGNGKNVNGGQLLSILKQI